MRKLLNTLYVTTPESFLHKDGMDVVVSKDKEVLFRIPIINLESIVTFGYMGASPGLVKLCVDNGVSLSFLSPQGQFIGRFQGMTQGNVLLRKKQYQLSEDKIISLHLCKIFISGKIYNCRNVLCRFIRDNGPQEGVNLVAQKLNHFKQDALNALNIETLRGVEGMAASNYFGIFDNLIINQKKDFIFTGRNRRPPKDEVNCMLSFVYTLLTNEIVSALETVGLDPYVGFMHTLRPGRASLALDLTEELRAYLCDRLVLSLINRKQVNKFDFIRQCDDSILMTDSCRKIIISAWQKRKQEILVHPYLKEKMNLGLLPYVQVMLLSRYLRGDIDDYPVFLMK